MNAAEAREIVAKSPTLRIENETLSIAEMMGKAIEVMRKYGIAQGYLAALEGPEVKALVEALEFVHEAFEKVEDNELQGKYILNSHASIVKEALARREKEISNERRD